ncbi:MULTISPECIES: TetR/AcrR family transcriptional regulator [Pseudonocardia]|uniref:HTH-type transcriptional regulator BetI n=2 Tax=Pseudonocardia TaxID=1847 RepID=A0A1Y2N5J6_PSEAH|nr:MULTISPECIES: TetR/AcrR family transcriptional regulator [Pseudonocardia]OSY42740.1 HTH-type transcriptional regulator BetI [Pseudonocardia autotrophica]TDN77317.1 TetR family transcriptional regulator [Pseudonocardia autotrophica]BBG01339.1 ebrA repressor [Pseudonocardia autotrophica]GEC24395.1 ebrA repressor [Pseudonocardia saturnea]
MAPDDRRTAIIQAVWQVIARRGMGAVSMRTVAAEAGVSVGRIQYWFPSKDELVRAGLEAMLTGAGELHVHATAGADDRERLRQLVGHPIPHTAAQRAGVSVFHQYAAAAINHPALAALLAEAKDGQEREATRLLTGIAPTLDDPRAAARALIATADGLVVRVLIGGLSADDAESALGAALHRLTD